MTESLSVIGWREWLGLPELGVKRVKAKIDTGARSSSLHALDVEEFRQDDRDFVRFVVYPRQKSDQKQIQCEMPVLEFREIRSSNGRVQRRPVIRTNLQLLGREFAVDLTLADRSRMGFRMLVGREALRGRFLVDSGASFLCGRRRKSKPVDDATEELRSEGHTP